MKPVFWTTFLALALVLAAAGCAPSATAIPLPPVALDTTGATTMSVKASAVVVPAQKSSLSFVISGLVKEVAVKEGDRVEAGQALIALDMAEQEFAVVAAEAALYSAEVDATLQRIRRKYTNPAGKTIYLSGPREKILKADAKVDQMRAALETAKAALAQGTLLAPFEGTVVEVDVSPGEFVQPAQRVFLIADLKNLQIETTDLSELNVAVVNIGQQATVFVEALNEVFTGKVSAISPIFDTIGGDVVFQVTIQLDKQPHALLWGMSADVEVNLE